MSQRFLTFFCALSLAAAGSPPLAAADEAELKELLTPLADEDFHVRENASRRLLKLGKQDAGAVQRFCLDQLRHSPDPEVRLRCRAILRDLLAGNSSFIGVRHQNVQALHNNEQAIVAEITQILPDLPAEAAGLQRGDHLVTIDGKPLDRFDPAQDLIRRISGKGVGEEFEVEVMRGGERLKFSLTTVAKPAIFQEIDPEARLREWLREQAAKEETPAEE